MSLTMPPPRQIINSNTDNTQQQHRKPRCDYCDEPILDDECTEAEGKVWHISHFCCAGCKRPLGGQQYIMSRPKYADNDHSNSGSSSKSANNASTTDSNDTADHNGTASSSPLNLTLTDNDPNAPEVRDRSLEPQPYCLVCFDILFAELCEECGELIGCDVGAISHDKRSWHARTECFKCNSCMKPLLGAPFLPANDGKIYCSVACSRAASMIRTQKARQSLTKNKIKNLTKANKPPPSIPATSRPKAFNEPPPFNPPPLPSGPPPDIPSDQGAPIDHANFFNKRQDGHYGLMTTSAQNPSPNQPVSAFTAPNALPNRSYSATPPNVSRMPPSDPVPGPPPSNQNNYELPKTNMSNPSDGLSNSNHILTNLKRPLETIEYIDKPQDNHQHFMGETNSSPSSLQPVLAPVNSNTLPSIKNKIEYFTGEHQPPPSYPPNRRLDTANRPPSNDSYPAPSHPPPELPVNSRYPLDPSNSLDRAQQKHPSLMRNCSSSPSTQPPLSSNSNAHWTSTYPAPSPGLSKHTNPVQPSVPSQSKFDDFSPTTTSICSSSNVPSPSGSPMAPGPRLVESSHTPCQATSPSKELTSSCSTISAETHKQLTYPPDNAHPSDHSTHQSYPEYFPHNRSPATDHPNYPAPILSNTYSYEQKHQHEINQTPIQMARLTPEATNSLPPVICSDHMLTKTESISTNGGSPQSNNTNRGITPQNDSIPFPSPYLSQSGPPSSQSNPSTAPVQSGPPHAANGTVPFSPLKGTNIQKAVKFCASAKETSTHRVVRRHSRRSRRNRQSSTIHGSLRRRTSSNDRFRFGAENYSDPETCSSCSSSCSSCSSDDDEDYSYNDESALARNKWYGGTRIVVVPATQSKFTLPKSKLPSLKTPTSPNSGLAASENASSASSINGKVHPSYMMNSGSTTDGINQQQSNGHRKISFVQTSCGRLPPPPPIDGCTIS